MDSCFIFPVSECKLRRNKQIRNLFLSRKPLKFTSVNFCFLFFPFLSLLLWSALVLVLVEQQKYTTYQVTRLIKIKKWYSESIYRYIWRKTKGNQNEMNLKKRKKNPSSPLLVFLFFFFFFCQREMKRIKRKERKNFTQSHNHNHNTNLGLGTNTHTHMPVKQPHEPIFVFVFVL